MSVAEGLAICLGYAACRSIIVVRRNDESSEIMRFAPDQVITRRVVEHELLTAIARCHANDVGVDRCVQAAE
jgi:hypothetical protein